MQGIRLRLPVQVQTEEGAPGDQDGEDFEYGGDGDDAEDAVTDGAAESGVTNQFGVTIAPPKKPLS